MILVLSALAADPVGVGAGVILGIPTGISAAYRPSDIPFWFDAAAAWSFESGSVAVHADILLTVWEGGEERYEGLQRSDRYEGLHFPVWIGIGPRTRIGPDADRPNGGFLAVRIPFGVAVWHDGVPVEGFFEVAPGVGLIPETRAICDVAVGVRVYIPGTAGPMKQPAAEPVTAPPEPPEPPPPVP